MSILKAICVVHDCATEHDLKLGPIVLRIDQVRKMYEEIPSGSKPSLSTFLIEEHYMYDGVHLMWTRP